MNNPGPGLAVDLSLQQLVADFSESTGLRVELCIDLPHQVRSPDVTQTLYRVTQEGLTNIQRHARATTVQVSVRGSADDIVLTIQDDGVGPNEANGHELHSSGFGLIGLRERVALLDGQLSFGPAPDGGSRLSVSLPIRPPSVRVPGTV